MKTGPFASCFAKKPSQNCPMADDANDELSGLDVDVPDETINLPLV